MRSARVTPGEIDLAQEQIEISPESGVVEYIRGEHPSSSGQSRVCTEETGA
jgi:hypothetical protein